jgi:hypothetical protein
MGTALALPSSPITSADPVRILPCSWNFTISALKGPGCPDFADVSQTFTTRPTFGMNTVDGSEIYYWHFAYPYIHLSVGAEKPEASTWCETTLAYTEQQDCGPDPAVDPAYRLKLHKNGTRMLALYELDEGVEAKWKFTYATDGDDTVSLFGCAVVMLYMHAFSITCLSLSLFYNTLSALRRRQPEANATMRL